MGNGVSVKVMHDADSPTQHGMKSCLSESLEHYCTFDDLFEQILEILRDPLYPGETWLLKSTTVTEDGPEEFSVKVIHDGKKLAAFGWEPTESEYGSSSSSANPGEPRDRVRSWVKVRHSRAKREIITEEYHADGLMETRCTTWFLSNPLRVEFWADHRSGVRRCGKIYASIVKHVFLVPSIVNLRGRKVRVLQVKESVDGRGVSVLSGPLDEFTTHEALMDILMDLLKFPSKTPFLELKELSEFEFETKTPGPPSKQPVEGEPIERATLTTHYKMDVERGQIVAVVSVGNQLIHTMWLQVHRDPLRMEHWLEEGEHRLAGRMERMMLQELVDNMVKKAEGLDNWVF